MFRNIIDSLKTQFVLQFYIEFVTFDLFLRFSRNSFFQSFAADISWLDSSFGLKLSGKVLCYKIEMLNQKNAWNLISIGQYGIWKFRKSGENDAQNLISYKTVLMEAVQKILVKHLPNNIRNILWKFELEMFCWTLDICRSVFSTFSVPRPYYHAECEYFFEFFTLDGSICLYFNKLAKKSLLRSMLFEK